MKVVTGDTTTHYTLEGPLSAPVVTLGAKRHRAMPSPSSGPPLLP